MSRTVALCFLLCSSAFSFGQISYQITSAPAAGVPVVYVIDGSTLTTYNVDPETLQATVAGTLTLPESTYPGLVPSANGRFLYLNAYLNSSDQNHKLYVYDTDGSGVPEQNPVQQLNAPHLFGLTVHPSGKFVYSVAVGPSSAQSTTPYAIVRNLVNPKNGSLGGPVTEATYVLDSNVSGNDCYLWVSGFNRAGTTMYDGILCSGPHGSGSATFNQRTVDLQTGALGADQEVYNYDYYAGSESVSVQFEEDRMFAFVAYFNQGDNANLADVYQMSNVSTPLITCNVSMLPACGDFIRGHAHPSGKYVFLTDPTNVTVIGSVDLNSQQIVQTSSIPYEVQQFSPDGRVAYAANDVNPALQIEIYGFSVATGAVTQGGTINVPSDFDSWFAAERY